jgi:hypothetical protein
MSGAEGIDVDVKCLQSTDWKNGEVERQRGVGEV